MSLGMKDNAAPLIATEILPALSLIGFTWEGSYEEAAAGAIRAKMATLRRSLDLPEDTQLFGISWLDRPDGFRHFCGVVCSAAGAPADLPSMDLPSLPCLTMLQAEGDASAGYALLMGERERRGLRSPDGVTMIDQHLGAGKGLRLWLPYD